MSTRETTQLNGAGRRPIVGLGPGWAWACRRASWLALAAGLAGGLAACGGVSPSQLANLTTSTSSHANPTTTVGAGSTTTSARGDNASTLVDGWATCMRNHGDPNQTDPVIDANGAIHVTRPSGYFGTIYGASGNSSSGAGVACQAYLIEASTVLNGDEPLRGPSLAAVDRFAACMRANGVPSFPDPGGQMAAGVGGSPDPNSPIVQRASNLCARQTGAKGLGLGTALQPGEIEINGPSGGIREIVVGTEDASQ